MDKCVDNTSSLLYWFQKKVSINLRRPSYVKLQVEYLGADALCPDGGERATRSGARPIWPNAQR